MPFLRVMNLMLMESNGFLKVAIINVLTDNQSRFG